MRTIETPTDTRTGRPVAERVEPGRAAHAWLNDADYADAFRIAASSPAPAETWSRAAFEAGPPLIDAVFRTLAWRLLLGMRLGPAGVPGHVAGWTVVEEQPDVVVMAVDSWMLTGRLVTEVETDRVTITTLLRFDRRPASTVWGVAGQVHRAMMPGVLGRAARSVRHASRRADSRS